MKLNVDEKANNANWYKQRQLFQIIHQ